MGREIAGAEVGDSLVIGVGPGGDRTAALTRRTLAVEYPLFGDPTGVVYERFGFRRRLGVVQESGTIAVDRGGVVRLAHRVANPMAALPLDAVRAAIA